MIRSRLFPVIFLTLIIMLHSALTKASSPATLIAFHGKTEIRKSPGKKWEKASVNQSLAVNSTVRTGFASWASILFADQTQIKLSSNAIFQIKTPAKAEKKKTVVKLLKGKAWARFKKPSSKFIMRTPSANAGIQGTDWVMDVADDGTSTLSVMSGEIRFFNEYGEVQVNKNEEAVASPGSAPIKRLLVNPQQRVQWVAGHAIQWQQYPMLTTDPDYAELILAIKEHRNPEALKLLKKIPTDKYSASFRLLEADILQSSGELVHAKQRLLKAKELYPHDYRIAANLAQLALISDKEDEANIILASSLIKKPDSIELLLVKGKLSHLQGQYLESKTAYAKALKLAPQDSRIHFANARISTEREDYHIGHKQFLKALEYSPNWSEALSELGWLEAQADNLVDSRQHLKKALSIDQSDYVALTTMGYLELKTGHPDLALKYLLAANTIEPNYARAVEIMAIVYYQQGRVEAAIERLKRASELDSRDPIPWFLLSLIYQDIIQTGVATRAAQEGMGRLHYLKSVNQLATDIKGSSNLGSSFAQFGLESWAMKMAQDSYDPFWSGSHFFLANRYVGEFTRNAELTLGFLSDPTAFGTTAPHQPLVKTSGIHGKFSYWYEQADTNHINTPFISLNAYHNNDIPFAWLFEFQKQNVNDNGQIDMHADQFTIGLGLKPSSQLRLFLFANKFKPDVVLDELVTNEHIQGNNQRIDIGLAYRHNSQAQSWFKFGQTKEDSNTEGALFFRPSTLKKAEIVQKKDDIQLRHTHRFESGLEMSIGMEWAQLDNDIDYGLWNNSSNTSSSSGQDCSTDTSKLLYTSFILKPIKGFLLQLDTSYSEIITDTLYQAKIGNLNLIKGDYHEENRGLQLNIGSVYQFNSNLTFRTALQNWTRPVSFNTLSPVATAGIPVDDILTLPGGFLQRVKFQVEWKSNSSLSLLWADHREIENISFDPLAGPDNGLTELADLSRLNPQEIQSLSQDTAEGISRFASGEVMEWGFAHERILTDKLSFYQRYRYAKTKNTRWFIGNELPYVAKHQTTVGLTWLFSSQWALQSRATYRNKYFADAMNTQELLPGWDASIFSTWQSYKKDWKIDMYLKSLLNKNQSIGIGGLVSFRF